MARKIEVNLRLLTPFRWEVDAIKEHLEESGITLSTEYDEDIPVSLTRLKRRPALKLGELAFIANSTVLSVRDTPEELVDFLRKLKKALKNDLSSIDERVASATIHLDTTIDRSMFAIRNELNLTPNLPALKKATGIKLRNACIDVYGPWDEKNWFHITIGPELGDQARTTHIRLAASRPRVDEMIALLKRIPAVIEAIQQDLWES